MRWSVSGVISARALYHLHKIIGTDPFGEGGPHLLGRHHEIEGSGTSETIGTKGDDDA